MRLKQLMERLSWGDGDGADDPRFEIKLGLAAIGVFFVGFLGWAAIAPLDAAAFMSGNVTASGGPRAVQSREGGVIQALNVREGDHVAKGQVLMDLAAEDVRTNVRALTARVMARRAELARLDAEAHGAVTVSPWAGMDRLQGDALAEAQSALASQQGQLVGRLAARETEREVMRQKVIQSQAQLAGAQRELAALRTQRRVVGDQLRGMQTLADKGYAPRLKISELESSVAGIEGALGSRQSDVARMSSAIGEAQLNATEFDLRRERTLSEELRVAQEDLRSLEPQLAAAEEHLRRAEVRSPATGRVFALKANTVGGVAQPGEVLMRVIPDDQGMVVEAKLLARDAADVKVGQKTHVRFPAFKERNLPTVQGVITRISADSYQDERTGVQFFNVEVRVPDEALAEFRRVRGVTQVLMPGLAADAMVTLRKRTALQYALEPMVQTFSRSFHEH